MSESCGSCRFSTPGLVTGQTEVGAEPALLCRRHPPQHLLVEGDLLQLQPMVTAGDWCGEYKPQACTCRRLTPGASGIFRADPACPQHGDTKVDS
jgi:hypothetical protein